MRRRPRLVTLTTDIGWAYAAQMKGVLHTLAPGVPVVDLAHDLPAHGVREAAFLLRQMAGTFPPGSVHVAVVDPGVGGRRRPIAIECVDGTLLVGPDNGVLTPLAQARRVRSIRAVRPGAVGLGADEVSATFEGRDLFARAAALLARGTPIERLGPAVGSIAPSPLVPPRPRPHGADGTIVHVDRFGNLVSDVPAAWLPEGVPMLDVRIGGRRAPRLSRRRTYEEFGPPGSLGLLGSSFGTVEVAAREASAARSLGASAGDALRLDWPPPSRRRPPVGGPRPGRRRKDGK
ncbi:MAG TPA: SAM-dependent chlorinase/fluorinase [Thermoplasmata archaeon]|nr:SAM-dependent chlorinase/fluorinase [Thermoplasmata archaeon]